MGKSGREEQKWKGNSKRIWMWSVRTFDIERMPSIGEPGELTKGLLDRRKEDAT